MLGLKIMGSDMNYVQRRFLAWGQIYFKVLRVDRQNQMWMPKKKGVEIWGLFYVLMLSLVTVQVWPLPIIALTASAPDEVKDKVLEAGMDDFSRKPFKLQDLELILKRFSRST
jgi:CheY-like chemotaxis protein